MSSAKVAAACVLAAMSLSACGTAAKPVAGSAQATAASKTNITDPRVKHLPCLHQERVPFREEKLRGPDGDRDLSLQVGTRPSGPTVVFLATPGAAQYQQIAGQAQGAEVIGSALLYPNQASDKLLDKVEYCIEKGVTG